MDTHVTLRDWKIEDSTIIPKLANNKIIWDNLRDDFPYPYQESDAINFINKVKENEATFSKAVIKNGQYYDQLLYAKISF